MSIVSDLRSALDPAATFEQAFELEPLGWQRDYLRQTANVVLVKGRQVGASLAAAALAIHRAVYYAGSVTVIVSPSLKQSTEIAGKARGGLRNLALRLTQDSTSMLRLANGSRIVSLPGTARSVRGWTAQLLIIDEAAYVDRETYVAARALVAATGGRVLVQSTPAEADGEFHQLVTGADPAWTRLTVRSDEVPTIDPAFLDAERRTMAPDEFAREYECAFGKTGATLFSLERIERLFREPDGDHDAARRHVHAAS